MKIIRTRGPGTKGLGRVQGISRMARQRLKWMDYYTSHGSNASLTCRYFGMSRQTLYRWKKRYKPRDLSSLEERSHKAKHLRRPTWSPQLAQAVLELREEYPRWGKDKLVVLLHQKGWQQVSTSMVGRILTRSRVPGSGVRGRGSGERETTASSLAGKEESSRKEDNSGQGKDGPAGAIAQGGNGR